MKKLFFFMAALFVSTATTLTSCSDDDSQNEVKDPTERYSNTLPVTLQEPNFTKTAKKYAAPAESGIKSFEITESGCCLVEEIASNARTRAAGSGNFILGTILIVPSGIHIQAGKYKIDIDERGTVKINNIIYNCRIVTDAVNESTNNVYICREWEPISYHAYITADGKIYYNKVMSDLMALQHDLFKYILASEPKDRNYIIKDNFNSIILSKAGTFAITSKNGNVDYKSWNWVGDNTLSIANSNESEFPITTVKFSGDMMYLSINVSIDVISEAINKEAIDAKLVITLNAKKS